LIVGVVVLVVLEVIFDASICGLSLFKLGLICILALLLLPLILLPDEEDVDDVEHDANRDALILFENNVSYSLANHIYKF